MTRPYRRRSPLALGLSGKIESVSSEYSEHVAFVKWLNYHYIFTGNFYHPPNGGIRSAKEGAKYRRMGESPGVPDICIALARGTYHGLYIELKKKIVPGKPKPSVSAKQREWLNRLRENGYCATVCYGASEAILEAERYWSLGEFGEA